MNHPKDGDLYILPSTLGDDRNGNFLVRVRTTPDGRYWVEYIHPATREASGSSGTWGVGRFKHGQRIPKHVSIVAERRGCGHFYSVAEAAREVAE